MYIFFWVFCSTDGINSICTLIQFPRHWAKYIILLIYFRFHFLKVIKSGWKYPIFSAMYIFFWVFCSTDGIKSICTLIQFPRHWAKYIILLIYFRFHFLKVIKSGWKYPIFEANSFLF